jgi:hypothetical protein
VRSRTQGAANGWPALATSHPQVLATLVGKLLPQSLANDPENPLTAPLSAEAYREWARAQIREAFAPYPAPGKRRTAAPLTGFGPWKSGMMRLANSVPYTKRPPRIEGGSRLG